MKEEFRQPIKEQRMARVCGHKIVEGIKITPTEVKEYYEKIPKDSLLFYESELQIGQIVVYPKASRDIELLAIDELNEYKTGGGKRYTRNLKHWHLYIPMIPEVRTRVVCTRSTALKNNGIPFFLPLHSV